MLRCGQISRTFDLAAHSSAGADSTGTWASSQAERSLMQARDQGSMHGVSGALGNDVALDAAAGQSQVADQIENLVAHIFIGKAQGAVLRAAGAEDDGVFRTRAANQAHVAEALLIGLVAKGAGGGNGAAVGFGGQIDAGFLAADGSGKVDGVFDAIAGAGIDADELVALADLDRMENANGFAAAALGADAGLEKGFNIGQCAAVENGEFEVVELDDDVVDAHADEGGEQVFGGGDEHALAHEAGGVADLGDVAAVGGNLKVVEVGAAKDNARSGRRRQQPHGDRRTGMEPYACEFNLGGDGLFQVGGMSQNQFSN